MIGTRLIDRHEITHELGTGGNEIIVQLLEKNPNERPASAAEVGYLLEILSALYRMTVVQ